MPSTYLKNACLRLAGVSYACLVTHQGKWRRQYENSFVNYYHLQLCLIRMFCGWTFKIWKESCFVSFLYFSEVEIDQSYVYKDIKLKNGKFLKRKASSQVW